MRRKYKTVYTFDELSDEAKEKAREWWREGGLDYEWWDCTYEDAKRVGLEITSFDLYQRDIDGNLTMSVLESIKAILKDHGKDCATYQLALKYQELLQEDIVLWRLNEETQEHDDYQPSDDLYTEYRNDLCSAYLNMLQDEADYLESDKCVDETIRANEYEFTKEGERA